MFQYLFNWLSTEADKILAAAHATNAALSLTLCAIVFYYTHIHTNKYNRNRNIKSVFNGITMMSFGLTLHFSYLFLFRVFLALEQPAFQNWIIDNRWVHVIPVQLIFIGCVLILAPIWYRLRAIKKSNIVDKRQFIIVISLAIGFWWFIYWQIQILDINIDKVIVL